MAAATEARAAAGEGATAEAPMVAQAAAVVAKLPPELRFLKAASLSRPRLALSTAPALLREPLGMVLVRLGRSHGGEIWSQALGVELERSSCSCGAPGRRSSPRSPTTGPGLTASTSLSKCKHVNLAC